MSVDPKEFLELQKLLRGTADDEYIELEKNHINVLKTKSGKY